MGLVVSKYPLLISNIFGANLIEMNGLSVILVLQEVIGRCDCVEPVKQEKS
jgi:hypothetical protein